jgi:hypothetical protein
MSRYGPFFPADTLYTSPVCGEGPPTPLLRGKDHGSSFTPPGVPPVKPQTFELVRYTDISGVSGTGVVAEGCVFTDGSVALRWHGANPSTAVWPDLDSILAVHGHRGATVVRWLDVSEMEPVPGTDLLPGELTHILATGRRTHSPTPAAASA